VVTAIKQFRLPSNVLTEGAELRESEVIGALAGYLSKLLPDAKVEAEAPIVGDRAFRVDVSIVLGGQRVLIEVKRARPGPTQIRGGINQLTHYMALSDVRDAVLFFYSPGDEPSYDQAEHLLPGLGGRVLVVAYPTQAPAQQAAAADAAAQRG
jgi:hypothetical protein